MAFSFAAFIVVTNSTLRIFKVSNPEKIPPNHLLNTEHLWPQSHFSKKQSKRRQKNDLYHLQITSSSINSTRGNKKFGETDNTSPKSVCEDTFIGKHHSSPIFQPTSSKRGNIARSLFYFSIRYKIKISPHEEKYLRKWHHEDPVDEKEWLRYQEIIKIQNNRNPFIDYPQLADRITNF